jgi:hypothetical protein
LTPSISNRPTSGPVARVRNAAKKDDVAWKTAPTASGTRTMDHRIVRKAFEPDARIFPGHPEIEAIVGSPRGVSPRGSHGTERSR